MIRLEDFLKASRQDLLKMSWRRLEEVFKTSWICLEGVLKTSWRRLEDVWPRQMCWFSEDVRLRRIYSSWPRRLEDVLKTSSEVEEERRLQNIFKTSSSRRMFSGKWQSKQHHATFFIELEGVQCLVINHVTCNLCKYT